SPVFAGAMAGSGKIVAMNGTPESRLRLNCRGRPIRKDPRRTADPCCFASERLASGLLGRLLGSSVSLEMNLAFLPLGFTGLGFRRELRLGSLEASTVSGFCRRGVDGHRCTSHETRDGSGEKHSLQHDLLRFVFGKLGKPMRL